MGAGIAQLGALAGMDTLVYDPIEGALERGMRQIKVNLMKGAERGRWDHDRVGEAMGKTVIVASDGPGFLVNRCGRPFGAESLRLLQERVATHDQIDRICRLGGGFRMGPFELMDMVGIDVGFEVAKSFDAQSFGEPRWRANMLQARMVASGLLGRKTGAGWYRYEEGEPHR